MRVATSEEYHCNPMVIYETWPWEMLWDAHEHLNYIDDLRAHRKREAELKKAGMLG